MEKIRVLSKKWFVKNKFYRAFLVDTVNKNIKSFMSSYQKILSCLFFDTVTKFIKLFMSSSISPVSKLCIHRLPGLILTHF
jgi:hypothetical protein